MWAFQTRARQEDGTLAVITLPLREHIETLKKEEWDNMDIAIAVIRGAKWIEMDTDPLLPDGTPVELAPISKSPSFQDLTEYDYALEQVKLSMFNPINEGK